MKIRVILRGYSGTTPTGSTDVCVTVDVPVTDPNIAAELKRLQNADYVGIAGVDFVEAED